MSGSLDTNIILRLILDDVPAQTKLVHQLFDEAGSDQFVIEPQVFVEAEYALRVHYRYTRAQIAFGLGAFAQHPRLLCPAQLLENAFVLYERHNKLSFVDIYLTLQAKSRKAAPLYTFDQNLSEQMPGAEQVC